MKQIKTINQFIIVSILVFTNILILFHEDRELLIISYSSFFVMLYKALRINYSCRLNVSPKEPKMLLKLFRMYFNLGKDYFKLKLDKYTKWEVFVALEFVAMIKIKSLKNGYEWFMPIEAIIEFIIIYVFITHNLFRPIDFDYFYSKGILNKQNQN